MSGAELNAAGYEIYTAPHRPGAIRERGNFVPAITDYMTDTDRAAYREMDADTPMRVREIMEDD